MTEELVFNGINGDSGEYGLKPMTAEELAQHIRQSFGRGDSGERDKLELELRRKGVKKIEPITELLARGVFDESTRDAAWRDRWLGELADLLADELLGGEYTQPWQLERLADRLRGDTEEKIVKIVTFLAEGKSKELAELLLVDQDQEPDNSRALLLQLKPVIKNRLDEVIQSLLSESRAAKLEGGAVDAQRDWLKALIASLRLVPIQILDNQRGESLKPREPLIKWLDALATASVPPSPWLETLRQALNALPGYATWTQVLDTLRAGLEARIADQEDAISWSELLDTLSNWLADPAWRTTIEDYGLREGLDPKRLNEAGWAVIFPAKMDDQRREAIKEALDPLLDLRRKQVGDEQLFRILEGGKGYRPGEDASGFASRHGGNVAKPVDPKKLPYYLLIVGSPEEIPFHFQYQLDVQYAVGRIDFGDDVESYANYANYARSVVAAEEDGATFPRIATFFGVSNPGDPATQLSADLLVKPLHNYFEQEYGTEWQIGRVLPADAKKARLKTLLGGDETPSLLFAACHGMEFDKEAAAGSQTRYQGALLCGDWQGHPGKVPREYYLAGEDLTNEANLQGLIAFFFACYSAGTPRFDEYSKQAFEKGGKPIADQAFVAHLPRTMLSLPKGALAVIGHVERAWGFSFKGEQESEELTVFQSAVERLLKGHPVGSAMEYFDGYYAALSTELTSRIEKAELFGMALNEYELAKMWTENNDARGYIIIGDPAVRLPAAPRE